jgi:hypothetical protein
MKSKVIDLTGEIEKSNKQEIIDLIDIHEDCKAELDFSDDLKPGDSCISCEFCASFKVYMDGGMTGMSAGDAHYCTKGYWKEEI